MFEFLQPVSEALLSFAETLPPHTLGQQLKFYSEKKQPELKKGMLVIFSVAEVRNNVEKAETPNFDLVRKEFYKLAKGNWALELADIGEIRAGNTIEDTYFAVKEISKTLLEKKCIPIVLGGGQDIMYAQYRAYDPERGMVNMVNIDSHFDLGNVDLPISNKSFFGKIVIDQPYNLFNYTNLGYQSYYVAPEELDLMDRMFFEGYRLGNVISNLSLAEPILRDADIVGIDCNCMSAAFFGNEPNGFNGREICALSRYAGISENVTFFGIYEYFTDISAPFNDKMVAQVVWYFVEGVSSRWNESGKIDSMEVVHYQVPVEDEILSFYKSKITERWWMEITYSNKLNNNLISDALLPCTYEDYMSACNQIIPDRWYKAKMKYEM